MKTCPLLHRVLAAVLAGATAAAGQFNIDIDAARQTVRSTYQQRAWVTADAPARQAPRTAGVVRQPRPADNDGGQQARLNRLIPLHLKGVTAGSALQYIADLAGLNLVIDWQALALIGADPQTPVSLDFRAIPARKALEVVCMQMTEQPLFLDVDRWITRILTREQANREVVVRIYPVGDLLFDVPDFDNAPQFDLNAIVTDDVGGTPIFSETTTEEKVAHKTAQEKGEELADMIRQTIEPDLWMANGGNVASIRYFNGALIVRAPKYVHRRLGFTAQPAPAPAPRHRTYNASVSRYSHTTSTRYGVRVDLPARSRSPVTGRPVGGVGHYSSPTAGVGR